MNTKYKIAKLDAPIYRSGRRVFYYKIYKTVDGSTLFLFEDLETAEQTLEKLN